MDRTAVLRYDRPVESSGGDEPRRSAIDLTISIGTLGPDEKFERCLRSVYEEDSPHLAYEVWVVYNGRGQDGGPEQIETAFPQVKLIAKRGPLGYCTTHNVVLSQCRSRYALVLDDDTVVRKGTLSTMVAYMDAHPSVGIAGCRTLNADGTFQRTFAVFPSLRTAWWNVVTPGGLLWPRALYRDTNSVREVDWLNGSFMLVRAEVLTGVGLLDEHYYTYFCEADWCYRIKAAGWQAVYVPSAEIIHVGSLHSTNTVAKEYHQLVRHHVNQFYFFRKHYGAGALFMLRPLMMLAAATRLVYFGLAWLVKPRLRGVARTRLRAFWRVIKLSVSRVPHVMPRDTA